MSRAIPVPSAAPATPEVTPAPPAPRPRAPRPAAPRPRARRASTRRQRLDALALLRRWLRRPAVRRWLWPRALRGRLRRVGLLLAAAAALPVLTVNLGISYFGGAAVFPLSPFSFGARAQALVHYLAHRPRCLVEGHPPLGPIVARAEAAHRLPRGLLAAVVEVESSTRVHRISHAGAMGPGQLMPSTARLLGVTDPFDPESTIDGSARYLAAQLARFRDVRLALAAYNAGPGSIVRRAVPRNGQTPQYVDRVMRVYAARRAIRRARPAGPPPLMLAMHHERDWVIPLRRAP